MLTRCPRPPLSILGGVRFFVASWITLASEVLEPMNRVQRCWD